jgi:hypothetical protein
MTATHKFPMPTVSSNLTTSAEPGARLSPARSCHRDTSPAQTGRFFHVEWSAGVAARGHSRIGHVHND